MQQKKAKDTLLSMVIWTNNVLKIFYYMEHVKCVKCGKETEINLHNALDEEGEVFKCQHCGYMFRYTKE